jgi:hypothetical protein
MPKMPAVRSILFATLASLAAGCGVGDDQPEGLQAETAALVNTLPLYLRQVMFFDDHDVGDPEMFVKCTTSSGRIGRKDLANVDAELHSYTPNVKVMDIYSSESWVKCEIWEDDSNANDFVGEAVTSFTQMSGTTGTSCAGVDGPYFQLGLSKVKGANLCPELAVLGDYYCSEPCSNLVLLRK